MKTQEREREREVTLEYDWMKILKVRGERTRISYFLLMNGRGKEYIYVCTCGLRGARHVIQYKPRMFGFNFNHACNIINSNILPKKKSSPIYYRYNNQRINFYFIHRKRRNVNLRLI